MITFLNIKQLDEDVSNGSVAFLSFDPPVIYTSPAFEKLSEPIKMFVLLHEEGHFVNDSEDEFEADRHAFYRLSNIAPELIDDVLNSMTEFLTLANDDHQLRIESLKQLKLEFMALDQPIKSSTIYKESLGLSTGVIVEDVNSYELQNPNVFDSNQKEDEDRLHFNNDTVFDNELESPGDDSESSYKPDRNVSIPHGSDLLSNSGDDETETDQEPESEQETPGTNNPSNSDSDSSNDNADDANKPDPEKEPEKEPDKSNDDLIMGFERNQFFIGATLLAILIILIAK